MAILFTVNISWILKVRCCEDLWICPIRGKPTWHKKWNFWQLLKNSWRRIRLWKNRSQNQKAIRFGFSLFNFIFQILLISSFYFSKYFCHQELKQGAILAETKGSRSKKGLSKWIIWLFFPFQSHHFYFISILSSSKFSGWIFISNRLIWGFKLALKFKVCLFLNRKKVEFCWIMFFYLDFSTSVFPLNFPDHNSSFVEWKE